MTLLQMHPTHGLLDVQNEVNRLFDGVFGPTATNEVTRWLPAVDILESEGGFTVLMDLPGIQPDDVKIRLLDGALTIEGERRFETVQDAAGRTHRSERQAGAFRRAFTLRTPIDAAKISAKYRDGVLEVFVPRADEAKPREIPIQLA